MWAGLLQKQCNNSLKKVTNNLCYFPPSLGKGGHGHSAKLSKKKTCGQGCCRNNVTIPLKKGKTFLYCFPLHQGKGVGLPNKKRKRKKKSAKQLPGGKVSTFVYCFSGNTRLISRVVWKTGGRRHVGWLVAEKVQIPRDFNGNSLWTARLLWAGTNGLWTGKVYERYFGSSQKSLDRLQYLPGSYYTPISLYRKI